MEVPRFLKPKEYKPLEIPRIRALDLRDVVQRRSDAKAVEVPIVEFKPGK